MMTTVQATITIDRPPQAVEDVIRDPEKAVLWTSDLERFEVVSGESGEAGAVAHLHYLQNGRRYVMEDVLLEVEPGHRYVSRVSGEALTAEVETTLTPENGGTRVAIRWSGRGKPLLLRLLLPFMRGAIRRQAQTDLEKLKGVVEGRLPGTAETSQKLG